MLPETLILFDIDGTLLHAGGSGRVATERAMIEIFGTAGKLSEHRFLGKTDWNTLHALLTAEGISEEAIASALSTYATAMGRHMSDIIGNYQVQALPGTLELVKQLRKRPDVLTGIITGNVREAADIKLRAGGFALEDFPVGVYGSEARFRRDLTPIVLTRSHEYCGVKFDPANVVIVGDTPDDIDCAHIVGARAVAVTTGWVSREELEAHPPVTVLDNLENIQQVMEEIFLGKAS